MNDKALEIQNLEKIYKNGFRALNNINLDVEKGDFFALLGPNGAGKSTTIGILSSLVKKSKGEVKIFGFDIDKELELAKTYLGIVPQEFNFSIFEPVRHIIRNQAGYYGIPYRIAKERTDKYLELLQLKDKANVPAGQLSGGMKRRLMIARALVHEPEILILDEPTAGVDIEIRRSMWDFLKDLNNSGKTIILTTHYLEEAEQLCRNLAIIDKGEIIRKSSVKELLSTMSQETFLIDTIDIPRDLPQSKEFHFTKVDDKTLSIVVTRGQSMNEVFKELSRANISVVSLRNKSNRLEELFLNLVKRD